MKNLYISFLFTCLLFSCTFYQSMEKEVDCPSLTSPKGTEEVVLKSNEKIDTYIGFRGISSICFKKDNHILMNLDVNLRSIRKKYDLDDYISIRISLVSIDINKKEFNRDDFNYRHFLKKNNKIVDRLTSMSVKVPENGKVLIGILKSK